MKIVTVYYAYDDTEFYDYEECLDYEQYGWDMAIKLMECLSFYDNNGEEIWQPYLHNIEEFIEWYEKTYNSCESIRVKKEIPSSAYSWQSNIFGFDIPDEIGLFVHIFGEGWKKVDE